MNAATERETHSFPQEDVPMKAYLLVIAALSLLACAHTSTPANEPAIDMGPRITNLSYKQEGNAAFDACYSAAKDRSDLSNGGAIYFCTCIEMYAIANTKAVVSWHQLVYEVDTLSYIREILITPDQKDACLRSSKL